MTVITVAPVDKFHSGETEMTEIENETLIGERPMETVSDQDELVEEIKDEVAKVVPSIMDAVKLAVLAVLAGITAWITRWFQ